DGSIAMDALGASVKVPEDPTAARRRDSGRPPRSSFARTWLIVKTRTRDVAPRWDSRDAFGAIGCCIFIFVVAAASPAATNTKSTSAIVDARKAREALPNATIVNAPGVARRVGRCRPAIAHWR